MEGSRRLGEVAYQTLRCDGCGQQASTEHIAKRVRRLEWASRFRPIHMNTLLLGAIAPKQDEEYFYSPKGEFQGEAARILEAAGLEVGGKTAEAVHIEFQRLGLFVTHMLECPLELEQNSASAIGMLLAARLPQVLTRIRRSLKPKRVALVSPMLNDLIPQLQVEALQCPLLLDDGVSFAIDSGTSDVAARRLHSALQGSAAAVR